MNTISMGSNNVIVTRDTIERRVQNMRGRNLSGIIPVLRLPKRLTHGKFRKINTRMSIPKNRGVKDAVGEPRHEHYLVLRSFRMAKDVSKKLHSMFRGAMARRRQLWRGNRCSLGQICIRCWGRTGINNPVIIGRFKAQYLSQDFPV